MIKAPAWASQAIPTANGWEDPATGELLKSGRHTQAQIDEWFGLMTPVEEEIPDASELLIEEGEEEEWEEYDLESMSKLELEALGREWGIELDRREKKESLIEQLEAVMYEDEE
jgi:hypothetical protein